VQFPYLLFNIILSYCLEHRCKRIWSLGEGINSELGNGFRFIWYRREKRVVGRCKKGGSRPVRSRIFSQGGGALIFPRCSSVLGNRPIRGLEASKIFRLGVWGRPPAGSGAEPREPANLRACVLSKLYQKMYLLIKISLKILL